MDELEWFEALRELVKRENAWRKLTTGDTLFQLLRRAIHERQMDIAFIQEILEHIEECRQEMNVSPKDGEFMQAMVWCAGQAMASPDRYHDTEDMKAYRLGVEDQKNQPRDPIKAPDLILADPQWGWVCIRAFLTTEHERRQCVAWWRVIKDEQRKVLGTEAGIATLVLGVLSGGDAVMSQHPADVFSTRPSNTFEAAMEDAWRAARALAAQQNKGEPSVGVWRLLGNGEQPPGAVQDGSASAAAALGWYHALCGTYPDERVIVTAQITAAGEMTGVGGIPDKVAAIVADGRFDTIVVAREDNKQDAEDKLTQLHALGPIRVINVDEVKLSETEAPSPATDH